MGNETLTTLLAIVVGGVVIPIVGVIKKTVVVNYIRPEFLTAILAIVAAYGLSLWLVPGITIDDLIRLALASVGGTSLIYGTTKIVNGKKG